MSVGVYEQNNDIKRMNSKISIEDQVDWSSYQGVGGGGEGWGRMLHLGSQLPPQFPFG